MAHQENYKGITLRPGGKYQALVPIRPSEQDHLPDFLKGKRAISCSYYHVPMDAGKAADMWVCAWSLPPCIFSEMPPDIVLARL